MSEHISLSIVCLSTHAVAHVMKSSPGTLRQAISSLRTLCRRCLSCAIVSCAHTRREATESGSSQSGSSQSGSRQSGSRQLPTRGSRQLPTRAGSWAAECMADNWRDDASAHLHVAEGSWGIHRHTLTCGRRSSRIHAGLRARLCGRPLCLAFGCLFARARTLTLGRATAQE